MTTPDRTRVLDAATTELRSAHSLIVDPRCDPTTALPHVQRAWRAIAWLSRGEVPEHAGPSLEAWLAPEHLALIPARTHAEVHATLATIFRFPGDPEPWAEAEPLPEAPSERALRGHLRVLAAIVDALTLQERGRTPKTQLALRWGLRATTLVAIAAGLVLVVVRPWQTGEGPWRAAYYPNKEFSGNPDVRRELDVDFEWSKEKPPSDTVQPTKFTGRWDTCLILDEDVEAAFQVVSNESSRVYLDGEVIVDNWDKAFKKVNGARVSPKAGRHHLRVEYRATTKRGAQIHLVASFDPAERPAPIPRRMLEFPGMEIDEDADPCQSPDD